MGEAFRQGIRRMREYVPVAIIVIGCYVLLTRSSVDPLVESQGFFLTFAGVGMVVALGAIASVLAGVGGAPVLWPSDTPPVHGLTAPVVVGTAVGLLLVILDVFFSLAIPHASLPDSIPFYVFGAIITEVLFRLVPLSITRWIVGFASDHDRWGLRAIWGVAIAVSLVEPIGIVGLLPPLPTTIVVVVFLCIFALNIAATSAFLSFGLLGAIVVRGAMYLVWHILYGGLL